MSEDVLKALRDKLHHGDWLYNAAADEIASLTGENERLRALLREIEARDIDYDYFNAPSGGGIRVAIRKALEEKE